MFDTYVGTTRGIHRWTSAGLEPLGLESERVSAVHAWQDGAGTTILAGTYENGLSRSDDGGETWTCEPILDDEDIHYVTGHPEQPDLLYAALGYASLAHRNTPRGQRPRLGGVARSRDGGRTWRKLEKDYTRALIVPP